MLIINLKVGKKDKNIFCFNLFYYISYMKNEKEILINLIQSSLKGKINPESDFNPQFLAEAIITKLNLNKTVTERNSKKVEDAIEKFESFINEIDSDMDIELEQLGKDETLLKNFARGQKTTCEKLRESLKTI